MKERGISTSQAEQLIAQGKIESAIAIYEQLLEKRKDDTGILNTVGDLYVRLGKGDASVPYFRKAAEIFDKSGFRKKAIATLRKAHRQKPIDSDVVEFLARLYQSEGLEGEAKTLLMDLGRHLQKMGNVFRAMEVYQQLVTIDPHYVPARMKLSEVFAAQGDTEKEYEGYIAVGKELMASGRLKEALKLLNQTHDANPTHPEVATFLAELWVHAGNLPKARALYTKLLKTHPENAKVLAGVGNLELEEGNESQAVAHFHQAQKLDPDEEIVRMLGAKIATNRNDFDAAIHYYEPLIEQMLQRKERGPLVKTLERMAQLAPDHVPTLKKLDTIYTYLEEKGELTILLDQLSSACEKAGDFKGAIEAAEKLSGLEPNMLTHKDRLARLHSRSQGTEIFGDEDEPPPVEEAPVPEDLAVETPVEDNINQKSQEILLEVDVLLRYGLDEKAKSKIQDALEELPNSPMLHEKLGELLRMEQDPKAALDHYSKAAELWDAQGKPEKSEELQETISSLALAEEPESLDSISKTETAPSAIDTPTPSQKASADPLEEQLTEAEYYLDQGFLSPAHQMLTELRKSNPNHPKVQGLWEALRSQVSEKLDTTKVTEELDDIFTGIEGGEKSESDLSDLTDDLEEELFMLHSAAAQRLDSLSTASPQQVDAEQFLSHLPPEAPQDLSKEDMRIHLELGQAYLECELFEEAINEFQLCAEDPDLRQRSCLLLGQSFNERGMDNVAIDWLQKGVETEGDTGLKINILTLLIQIFKKQGNTSELLKVLKALREIAPDHPALSSPLS